MPGSRLLVLFFGKGVSKRRYELPLRIAAAGRGDGYGIMMPDRQESSH